MDKELELITATIKAWIACGVHPSTLAIALNNAFMHGQILLDAGFINVEDNVLVKLYKGIDTFRAATDKIS